MQTDQERAKVQAFYYGKIAEGLSLVEARRLINYKAHGASWFSFRPSHKLIDWEEEVDYRIKPETVTHPGGEYPKPCDDAEAVEVQGFAYYPSWGIGLDGGPVAEAVKNSVSREEDIAASGMYHLTKEAALEHAKVMLGLK